MAYEHDWQGRIEDLEYRLAAYHEQLEEALEHDRQFQMKATWGIVNTAVGLAAFFGVLWGADKLGMEGWLLGTVAAFAALMAWAVAVAWSDKGREGDLTKLSSLPKWEGKWRD
jgi:hypothetical protein